ncbi:MAG TPA: ArsC/Spx/MgsR family protein [Anaeromyxobacteraceae bacterium]|nr:ArsC/Spx/MgsR family protein [Anaeromyxobacteraceae bacterium]
MATVIFFEDRNGRDNALQQEVLREAGHEVVTRDLFAHEWSAHELYAFLRSHPIVDWFDPEASRVKSGEVAPAYIDAGSALRLLLEDPMLLRRPLLQVGGRREVGFDYPTIDAWIGLRGEGVLLAERAGPGREAGACGA